MKLAVISDIHGNYKALEAFLQYLKVHPVEGIICLGDYVTDAPYPQRLLALLYEMRRQYPCYMIRGNREEYLINNAHESQGWHPSSPNGALYYTALHVTPEDIAFFESLPSSDLVRISGYRDITICHGAPEMIRGNFEFDPELKHRVMRELTTKYLLGGHSHHQEVYEQEGKLYVNPGALGLAIDHVGGRAEFACLHGDERGEWKPELLSISYDLEGFLQDFADSGLDEYGKVLNRAVKKTLRTGRNYFFEAVSEACRLSGRPLHLTTEDIWEQVAVNLEL